MKIRSIRRRSNTILNKTRSTGLFYIVAIAYVFVSITLTPETVLCVLSVSPALILPHSRYLLFSFTSVLVLYL